MARITADDEMQRDLWTPPETWRERSLKHVRECRSTLESTDTVIRNDR